jgi:hypothetical protein
MEDLIADELEHLAFMQEITDMRTRIYAARLSQSYSDKTILPTLYDIQSYGTEPVFASLMHDRMLAEAGAEYVSGQGVVQL